MADERQRQIREGAGLEESRINYDFIQWLQKWSTPILLVAAAISLGVFGLRKYREWQVEKVNEAYERLDLTVNSVNPSPATLTGIAEEYAGIRGIALLSQEAAAEVYRRSVTAAVDANVVLQPGEDASYLNPDGTLKDPDQRLSPEERERYLDQIEALNRRILDATQGKPELWIHALGATFRLAAVAEARGDFDRARALYEEAAGIAERADDPLHAQVARERIETLSGLDTLPHLYTLAEVPKPPEPAAPEGPTPGETPAEGGEQVGPPAPVEGAGAEPTSEASEEPPAPGQGEGGDPPPPAGPSQPPP